jgi:ketosteroid isomerase-like protein
MPTIPTYHSIVRNNITSGFHGVDNHDYAALADHFAPDIHHRFAGEHSLGGERHDAATVLAWLQRVGRVLPDLTFTITDVAVAGWPNNTTVAARWDAHASLADGGEPYRNRGVHIVRLRWFKIVDMDVYQDTQILCAALDRQAAARIDEATAAQITS